jgi:D-glycero-D-manno-heptose 1,7-bisphosphate phosphatase
MTPVNRVSSAGRFYEDIGVWVRVTGGAPGSSRPALFLDRDGVIVEDPGYLCRSADMVLIPGAAEVISRANRLGIPVIEVTNQAGIGRGYYGWEDYLEVETALARELARNNAIIDAAFACPYHRDGIAPWVHPAHPARKPRPGMLLAAQRFLNIDLASSWIVGDKHGDLFAGYNARLRGGLHVLTGQGAKHRQAAVTGFPAEFEVRLGDSIREAAGILDLLKSPGSSDRVQGRL